MPLSQPSPRQAMHTRRVTCQGYQREDGLWDIEGHLTDTKSRPLPMAERNQGVIPAGEAIHDLWLRITVDSQLTIVDAEAAMDATPYISCSDISSAYKKLIGLRIQGGFTRQVKERLGGTQGCTHLVELLGPLATTAYQTTFQVLRNEEDWLPGKPRPAILDTCHGWNSQGEVVKRYWPHFYKAGQ